MMKLSEGFTKPIYSMAIFICYTSSLTFLDLTLKFFDIGIVYATWSGVGTAIISNLAYADGKWKGTIYDPESGKTYNCQIKLVKENSLEVLGYIGSPLLGVKQSWKRAN